MKKTLISLAVMGAMVAPVANATSDIKLYGKADFQANKGGENGRWDLGMDKMRLGVMGDVENGIDDLRTFFQLEWDFAANNTPLASTSQGDIKVRKALVGIESGLGTVIAGRQQNPLQATEDTTDTFNSGDSDALHLVVDRLGKSISYSTPELAGFSAFGAVVSEDNDAIDTSKRHGDAYVYGLSYQGVPGLAVTAGIQDIRPATQAGTTVIAREHRRIGSVGASYQLGDLTLGAMAQKQEFNSASNGMPITAAAPGDIDVAGVRAAYKLGNFTFQAALNQMQDKSGMVLKNIADGKLKQGLFGIEYALGNQAATYVEVSTYDDQHGTINGVRKSDSVVIGYKIDF